MAEGGEADVETQRAEIAALLKTPLRRADTWFLVDCRWFKLWRKFVGFDTWDRQQTGQQSAYPGPVDNSGLLSEGEGLLLRDHLIDELDYILLPADGWRRLISWYGLTEGQQPIARQVVEQGMFVKHCKVEVYLTELKLCEDGNMETSVSRRFSKADTIDSVEREMRKLFSIPDEKETRLWNRYMSNTLEPLDKPHSTVQDAGLYQGQVLVIEQQNEDGSWPRGSSSLKSSAAALSALPKICPSPLSANHSSSFSNRNLKSSSYSSVSCPPYSSSSSSSSGVCDHRAGLCGLSNLGNTCFMNSATQCLSNVPPLTQFFLTEQYQQELNQDNPLGMSGEIARAYAELIKQLWAARCSYITPRPFKTQVGRFAPQFSGYQQQDSQELLAFLLDGLHEDLNRIRRKPYIQLRDADGRADEVLAQEAWESHVRRNDSIIVDIFHGLFKSTLVCPECCKVSVTFDPFCYLTLPLPVKKERTLEVFVVWLDPLARHTQYKVTVPKVGQISDLCVSLSALCDVPPEKMVVTDIYNHRFHRFFSSNENLSSIMERDDIYVFELPVSRQEDTEHLLVPVHLREKYKQSGFNQTSTPLFGRPFLLRAPHTLTEEKLYGLLLLRLRRFIRADPEDCEDSSYPKHRSVNGSATNGTAEECSPSEMETDEPDDELSVEQGVSSESNSSSPAEEQRLENGPSVLENGPSLQEPCRRRLFSLQITNMGKTDGGALITGEPHAQIHFQEERLSDRFYLSLVWEPEMKRSFFNEAAVEDFEKHHSMDYKPQKKMSCRLRDCIQLFTTKEKLGADDPWYCPSCKQHQQATKQLDLWSLPPVLVVHLKRFSYSRYMRDKLDTLVEFPLRDLDMSEFLINPHAGVCRYDLIAVSNHYGGMGGGHYTAYAKNVEDGQWYSFDDSSVSPVSEEQIVSKAAYVLFYQRQDTVRGTGYFALDREPPAEKQEEEEEDEDEEDVNDSEQEEDLQLSPDVSMSTS